MILPLFRFVEGVLEYADHFSFPLFVGGIGRGVRKAVPCNGLKKHLFLEKKSTSGLAGGCKNLFEGENVLGQFLLDIGKFGMV